MSRPGPGSLLLGSGSAGPSGAGAEGPTSGAKLPTGRSPDWQGVLGPQTGDRCPAAVPLRGPTGAFSESTGSCPSAQGGACLPLPGAAHSRRAPLQKAPGNSGEHALLNGLGSIHSSKWAPQLHLRLKRPARSNPEATQKSPGDTYSSVVTHLQAGPEVSQADVTVHVQQDVVGLDVPVGRTGAHVTVRTHRAGPSKPRLTVRPQVPVSPHSTHSRQEGAGEQRRGEGAGCGQGGSGER